jgi:FAD/FMN-containing dehydrogenase
MSGLAMPKPDAATLARRAEIVADMRIIVPGEGVVDTVNGMRAFESDGLTAYRQLPLVVVLPQTTAQVARILKYCNDRNIRVVPRGSGTSLSGGALPLEDAVLLVMSRFNRILDIDYANRTVTAQPGVTNLGITHAVEQEGFYYAPDPSSQIACSIGGNVAENSGGVHCLKYGLTANNVLGIEMVLMDGQVIRLGGKHLDAEGYDLLGIMTGSEGLLGVVTEVTVRILKKPEAARALLIGFPSSEAAGQCVADIIGAGIIPGGMEMMDGPAIRAAEDFVHAGYPLDVEALLIVELDGPGPEIDHLIGEVEAIALRARRRQRLPRRRRQSAPADPLRRQHARRAGQGGGLRRRHPAALRRGGRRAHRRARRRRREARPDGRHVHPGRPRPADAGQVRLRPQPSAQPGQGVPATAPLRRTRPHARASRADTVPGHSEVLTLAGSKISAMLAEGRRQSP